MSKLINRHEFLQTVGRTGMLLGMTGLGVAALSGSKTVSECFNLNYCSACDVYKRCELPEKKEAKNERAQDIREA